MEKEIILGGGCFWCIEAIMNELKGVEEVVAGYSGGSSPNPTYEDHGHGDEAHAEVAKITYDSEVISLHDLLTIFFTLHDPTTKDRQGADVGPQYRSIAFYADEEERQVIEQVMKEITEQGVWSDPIVTQVVPSMPFYEAEDYHQKYYENNPNQPYCQIVIDPKVAKVRKLFYDKLKNQEQP